MNMNNMVNRDLMKSTAWGAGVGAAGGYGLAATTGIGLALTGTALMVPPLAAGAVVGGLLGLAYGMGRQR
jgi:predicted phage tail protein